MTIINCGQFDILGDECPGCGGWLDRVLRGGFAGPNGWRYCDQQCIEDYLESQAVRHTDFHIGVRDLLCDCAEICAPRGLPTSAMLAEYAAYLESIKGTALDPRTTGGQVVLP